eukprot:scaffold75182_cov34-Prasinocladus_malaysianus.AAC.1
MEDTALSSLTTCRTLMSPMAAACTSGSLAPQAAPTMAPRMMESARVKLRAISFTRARIRTRSASNLACADCNHTEKKVKGGVFRGDVLDVYHNVQAAAHLKIDKHMSN